MRGQLRPEWAPTRSHQRGVEVGELTNHDDKFDEWLESQVMATTFTVEESVKIAATPENVFPYFSGSVDDRR